MISPLKLWTFTALMCAALLVAVARTATAGINVWTSDGLTDVGVDVLAIDPSTPATLYAGTVFGGVFKSTDGGGTWNAVNTGLASINIFTLAIDPSRPTTLYAATVLDSVFKSTNGGNTWVAAGPRPIGYALVIDPTTPTTLYVGTIDGVYKSSTGGASWDASGLTSININTLAIDPSTPTTLYAASPASGMFKTTDGGGSWKATGLQAACFALAIDPSTPPALYAGTATGVLKSTDGGDTWNATGPDSNAVVYALAIDRTMPETLYAGATYSDGTGIGGVFKSVNGGRSWDTFSNGLTSTAIGGLAIDPMTSTTLYAATGGGVFAIQQVAKQVAACIGDGDGSGEVTVNELVTLVNVALGHAQLPASFAGVPRGADVNVALIVQAVNNALNGCSRG